MENDDVFGLTLLISSVFIVMLTIKFYSRLMKDNVRQSKMEKVKR